MSLSDTVVQEPAPASARLSWGRLFYGSVRRELWENRSVDVAPLAVAVLIVFGFLLGTIHPSHAVILVTWLAMFGYTAA